MSWRKSWSLTISDTGLYLQETEKSQKAVAMGWFKNWGISDSSRYGESRYSYLKDLQNFAKYLFFGMSEQLKMMIKIFRNYIFLWFQDFLIAVEI